MRGGAFVCGKHTEAPHHDDTERNRNHETIMAISILRGLGR